MQFVVAQFRGVSSLGLIFPCRFALTGLEKPTKLKKVEVKGKSVDELKEIATTLCNHIIANANWLYHNGKYSENHYRDIAAFARSAFDTVEMREIMAYLERILRGDDLWDEIYCEGKGYA